MELLKTDFQILLVLLVEKVVVIFLSFLLCNMRNAVTRGTKIACIRGLKDDNNS